MKKCRICLSEVDLVKHHIAYKKRGAEEDRIITLCKVCHNFLHKFVKGGDEDLEFVTRNFIKAKKFWR